MKEIGLYLHIPFCIKKCKYCDFVSYTPNSKSIALYTDALKREIKMYSKSLSNYKVKTIFIGGGTPSILDIKEMNDIVKELFKSFNMEKKLEFSIETNPGTLTMEKLRNYRNIGINRLSIGLQSVNNYILRLIGRIHTREDFMKNYFAARNVGFNNINVDLIYGLPEQKLEDWEQTLEEVIKLEPEHVSVYSLKIEEGTVFKKLFDEDKLNLPSEEEDRQMHHLAIKLLDKHKIAQYEISNFSKKGFECSHNLIYWNNKEYLGLGVAAHSYLESCRYGNIKDIDEYINFINQGKLPIKNKEEKNKRDEIIETIFLALRLNKGLDLEEFKKRFNISIFEIYADKIHRLSELGLIDIKENNIRLTAYGMDVSNQVFVEFL